MDGLERMLRWARDNAPGVRMNKGASEADIRLAEAALGQPIPTDLRAYLLSHDGEDWRSDGFIGNWRLMPLEEIVSEWQTQKDMVDRGQFTDNNENQPTPYVKGQWWNPAWIPIVSSGSGHLFCLDLDPNSAGVAGQVILFLHDDVARPLVAHSLAAWFRRIADDMERGLYRLVTDSTGYEDFNNEAFMWSSIEGQEFYEPLPGEQR